MTYQNDYEKSVFKKKPSQAQHNHIIMTNQKKKKKQKKKSFRKCLQLKWSTKQSRAQPNTYKILSCLIHYIPSTPLILTFCPDSPFIDLKLISFLIPFIFIAFSIALLSTNASRSVIS